jgi:hypothetical protein
MNSRRRWNLVLLAAVCVGCGGGQQAASNPALSHVRLLMLLYNKATSTLGRPPKDEQEFKATLQNSNLALDTMKVSSLDELFVSERDNQPLVVVYKPPAGSDVVVYEQTGVDGKRLIAHRIGQVEEVDEAKFRELVPPAKAAAAK